MLLLLNMDAVQVIKVEGWEGGGVWVHEKIGENVGGWGDFKWGSVRCDDQLDQCVSVCEKERESGGMLPVGCFVVMKVILACLREFRGGSVVIEVL